MLIKKHHNHLKNLTHPLKKIFGLSFLHRVAYLLKEIFLINILMILKIKTFLC